MFIEIIKEERVIASYTKIEFALIALDKIKLDSEMTIGELRSKFLAEHKWLDSDTNIVHYYAPRLRVGITTFKG